MKRIRMARNFSFPLDVITQANGILGKRGSGKTTTASVMAEQMLEKNLPLVIIDPTGAWWGLRSSLDGKEKGYPITILGGDHADLPLEETAGVVIADLVAESAPPLVLDLSAMTKAGSRRFVKDFCEQLYRKNRNALHVILDEADEFAPQKLFRDALPVFGAVDTLVRRGRIRGIGITMVSQRSAAINKDILSQCEVLIAHRASHPTDIEPVMEWMKVHAKDRITEVHDTIAKLKNGEAWVMSPEWLDFFGRVQMNNRVTFNSSATPAAGQRIVQPKILADVDLKALEKRMAGTIERARADNPQLLRQRIAKLEAELRQAGQVKPAQVIPQQPAPVRVIEKPILKPADIKRLETVAGRLDQMAEKTRGIAAEMAKAIHAARALPKLEPAVLEQPVVFRRRVLTPDQVIFNAMNKVKLPEIPQDHRLSGGERRVLTALAQYPAGRTKTQVAILSRYAVNGGGFLNILSSLRTAGLIKGKDHLEITSGGAQALGDFAPLPTGQELLDYWQHHLGKAERTILEYLARIYPSTADKQRIGAETGYEPNGGGFNNAISRLRTLELIKGSSELSASEDFFQ